MSTTTSTTTSTASAALIDSLETMGEFFPLTKATDPKEMEGTRIAPITYKTSAKMKEKGIEARNNVYVRVPDSHLSEEYLRENFTVIYPYIRHYLELQENEIFKQYHSDKGTRLFTEFLGLAKIIDHLEANGKGSLSGEIIERWFTTYLEAGIIGNLLQKTDDMDKITPIVQATMAKFVSLASGKTKMIKQERDYLAKLIKAYDTEGSALGNKFLAKFEAQDKAESELLDALGGELSIDL